MSTSQALSAEDNPDPGPDPSTVTDTGNSAGTGTGSTPQCSYWRARGSNEPPIFATPTKFLCDCPNHRVWQWPLGHAELIIAPCAFRCPYCREFNKVNRTRLMASNLRRHITKTHIEGAPFVFGTLVVAPGMQRRGS
ncbi:hypothetical protein PDIG_72650 [Penicillium digitatum PHI26]|uniref:Uncharacterized protein n=2 Tax=Penicillium digitatum TaxID=36651 RepID=K9FE20_PEND2|nr:hypothetical protein PDIP_43120 [Penicillium digitatum Pd1]EKV07404.1 hypothetical protein PDIG_72650 [Penicillium digitatum PHI26]EKV14616.1 hypothetical protein PDIP_43120 [Penicillium digitatum Pd1]KAG0159917.1 hypothetical protein PDIDSM_7444 [Penicillium digitatum]